MLLLLAESAFAEIPREVDFQEEFALTLAQSPILITMVPVSTSVTDDLYYDVKGHAD